MPSMIACLLAAMLTQSLSLPEVSSSPAPQDASKESFHQAENKEMALRIGPVNVAPTGWRRTVNGWERAETWPLLDQDSQTSELNRLVIRQRQAEQSSLAGKALSSMMGFVRNVDPVTLVCGQISLLALYIALVFHREARTKRNLCPKTLPNYQSN